MKQRVRNMIYRLIFCMFYGTILLSSCFGSVFGTQDSAHEVIEIRIDPFAAPGGVDTVLFDSIIYIPLETNRQSGFSTITQLEVTENYYIILDERLNTFFSLTTTEASVTR